MNVTIDLLDSGDPVVFKAVQHGDQYTYGYVQPGSTTLNGTQLANPVQQQAVKKLRLQGTIVGYEQAMSYLNRLDSRVGYKVNLIIDSRQHVNLPMTDDNYHIYEAIPTHESCQYTETGDCSFLIPIDVVLLRRLQNS